jgi:hypothetical protein
MHNIQQPANISADEEFARRLQQQEFGSFFSFGQQQQQQQPHNNYQQMNTNSSMHDAPLLNNSNTENSSENKDDIKNNNHHVMNQNENHANSLLYNNNDHNNIMNDDNNNNPLMPNNNNNNNDSNTGSIMNDNGVNPNNPNNINNNNINMNNNGAARAIRRDVINSVRNADTESARVLLFRATLALVEMIATAVVLGIGWNESSSGTECGALKYWVLVYSARHLINIPLRIFIYRLSRANDDATRQVTAKSLQMLRWISIMTFLWFLVGQTFLFTGKACQTSAPTVWYYCLTIIIIVYVSLALPFLIVLAICICLPCVLIVFRFFAEPEGAADNIIQKLPTRKVSINELNSDGNTDSDDDNKAEDPSCAICMQDYKANDELRVLPCGHEFHTECVDKWLPMKKICPLCRHDITKPMETRPHQSKIIRRHTSQNNVAEAEAEAEEDTATETTTGTDNKSNTEAKTVVEEHNTEENDIQIVIESNAKPTQHSLGVMVEDSPPPYSSLLD